MEDELTLEDAPFIAGVECIDPTIESDTLKSHTGRVSYVYRGDNAIKARKAMQRIYNNETVNIYDFIITLKQVRGRIFREKNGGR